MPAQRLNGRTYEAVLVRGNPNDPLPVDIQGATITIGGFALPPYDEFELDDPDVPTEILYKKDGVLVATVTLAYDVGGGLISGAITYPAEA